MQNEKNVTMCEVMSKNQLSPGLADPRDFEVIEAGESATMSVENDGGWCWTDTYERSNWHTLSANSVAVTNASRHGHVLVRDIENQEVRVAYQPEPGFAGRDSFSIHYGTDGSEKTFLITVFKPMSVAARRDGVRWSDR